MIFAGMCGWTQKHSYTRGSNNVIWLRISPTSHYIKGNLLKYDHTTNSAAGNYLVMPLQMQDGSITVLRSPLIYKRSEKMCLALYYFAQASSGIQVVALKISLFNLANQSAMVVGSMNATTKLEWTRWSHELSPLPDKFIIQIESKYSRSLQSDIAIDDILVMQGGCLDAPAISTTTAEPVVEKVLDCDFDNGPVNWDFDKQNWQITNSKNG